MNTLFKDEGSRTLIDELLAEQQQLTAVERFARKHTEGSLPAQARYYRSLLPAAPPAPGEQYAFAVDLDVCTGCKACVSACHSLNGLDDDEIWRNVGLLVGGAGEEAYQQVITTACHHCVDPACAEGCPVLAYEKDEDTGIVRHLDDQCIGCQYCVLKCPYDVPKYSEKRGIVRKCDMCYGRLTAGEAPACVQACPNGAIEIRVVSKAETVSRAEIEPQMLPGAFDSNYTHPTTTYRTSRPTPPNRRAADAHQLRLDHAHWPLIWMLLLTQLAAGVYVTLGAIWAAAPAIHARVSGPVSTLAFLVLNAGLGVSVLHLGRPFGAWKAFLGLRKSWMSREIVVFSAFAGAAALLAGLSIFPWIRNVLPAVLVQMVLPAETLAGPLTLLTALLGCAGVFCSAMIYVDTRRGFWAARITMPRFFGTALLLGSASVAVALRYLPAFATEQSLVLASRCAGAVALALRSLLFGWEARELIAAVRNPELGSSRPGRTIWQLLPGLVLADAALFGAATLCSIGAVFGTTLAGFFAVAALALTFAQQLIERFFFFTAVDAPRMPGGPAT